MGWFTMRKAKPARLPSHSRKVDTSWEEIMLTFADMDEQMLAQRRFLATSLLHERYSAMSGGQYALHGSQTAAEISEWLKHGAPIDGLAEIEYGDGRKHFEAPLLTCLVDGHYEAASELLRSGANPDATNVTLSAPGEALAFTALHMMATRNELEAAKMLLAAGADPNRRTTLGFTPLHLAAEKGQREMVLVLLQGGADHQLKCLAGNIPSDIAVDRETRLLFG